MRTMVFWAELSAFMVLATPEKRSSELLASLKALATETSLEVWISFLVVLALTYLVLYLVKRFLIGRLKIFSVTTETRIDDLAYKLLLKTPNFFIAAVSFYVASHFLDLSLYLDRKLDLVLMLVLLLQTWFWGKECLEFFVSGLVERDKDLQESEEAIRGTMPALMFLGKLVLLSLILLLALDNFGFDITTLLTGLGVGGIAVALAVQNILGDLFASLSIVLDKPFKVGDFIVVGEMSGTVEKIGLKTTRVRSLGGEQLVFSNNDLLSSRIRNYKQMDERRIVFQFGVVYQTSAEQLEKIPQLVKELIETKPEARFDRTHFFKFGSSSLDFEVVYFVLKPDYAVYMETQQAINLDLFRLFEKNGIEFAYPTQTLFIEKEAAKEKV